MSSSALFNQFGVRVIIGLDRDFTSSLHQKNALMFLPHLCKVWKKIANVLILHSVKHKIPPDSGNVNISNNFQALDKSCSDECCTCSFLLPVKIPWL